MPSVADSDRFSKDLPEQAAEDADGSAHALDVTWRDLGSGPLNANTVLKAALSYRLESAADDEDVALEMSFAPGGSTESVSWTPLAPLDGDFSGAPVDAQGETPFSWAVRQKVRHARFRLVSSGPVARLTVEQLEVFTRPQGRI